VPTVWRLIKSRHAAAAFDGEGARRFGGRWSSAGVPVVYASDTPSLAVLEVLVHLQVARVLESYSIVSAEVPAELVSAVSPDALPRDWMRYPAPADARAIGDTWVGRAESAVLVVPSAIVDMQQNFLLNPRHPDFGRIVVGAARRFRFDQRLVRGP
jgi:RES domain-containing protein